MTFEPTPQQLKAIRQTAGDLFISAGAGSGKTAVLARRFAQAVVEGARVDDVLAITFTRKAAGEVSERVRRVLRYEVGDAEAALGVQHAWISTIHGFCSRLLRRHPLEAGVAPGFRVLDPTESGLMQEAAFEEAARSLWAEDEMRKLVGRFGAADVRVILLRLHARLRSVGATPGDLPELPGESLERRITEALGALQTALDSHPDEPRNATQAANAPALDTALSELGRVSKLPFDERPAAALAITEACSLKLTCPSTKEHVREAREALQAVASAIGDIEASTHSRTLKRLLEVFADTYRHAKERDGVLDQDDLQEAVERLFRERPEVARAYAERFRMIMVDEFQDTNELQVGVIEPLRKYDLCVVGDERQAIYSFRDADVEVFRRVRDGIAERVSLDTNFRSHPSVLGFVNALFSAQVLFGDSYAPLLAPEATSEDDAPRAEVLLVEREGWPERRWREAEARALAKRLAELVRDGVAAPGEIVVLLRAFTNSAPYVAALEEAGLPAVSAGGGAFASQPEIIELESLLAVAALPQDEESLAAVILGDLADLGGETLVGLHALAQEKRGLWLALEAACEGETAVAESERLNDVRRAVGVLRAESHRRGLGEALSRACGVLGVREKLLSRGRSGERGWANVRKLIRLAEAFSAEESSDLGAFVEHLRALRRLGGVAQAAPRTDDAVRLMTIHAAKGLEFPVVAVADLGRELHDPTDTVLLQRRGNGSIDWALRLPESSLGDPGHKPGAWLRLHDDETIRQHAEEKRLLYVACTRAEQRLILSGVCALDAPEDGTPAAWVREALGMADSAGEPGIRTTAGATWRLRLVRPEEASGERPAEAAPCTPRSPGGESSAGSVPVAGVPSADGGAGSPTGAEANAEHLAPAALSFSALKVFETCAYRFYAERVLGLAKAAHEASSARDFGNAVHAALELAVPGGGAETGVMTLPAARIEAIARAHNLPGETAGRVADAVATFSRTEAARQALAGDRVALEVPFSIPIAGTRLVGAMDLVSWCGNEALVIDYKTSSAESGDGLAQRYRLQAECYALALLRAGLERVEVAFVAVAHGGETDTLSFSAEDAPALLDRLEAMAAAACTGPYPRRERYDDATCAECAVLGGLCGINGPTTGARGAA